MMKRRQRHILVRMSMGFAIGEEKNWYALRAALLQFLGERTYSEARPKITRIVGPDEFIITCNRGTEQELVLALSFVKQVGGERIGFYTLKTSGTMKGLGTRRGPKWARSAALPEAAGATVSRA